MTDASRPLTTRDSAALGALAMALGVSALLWLAAILQAWIHGGPAPMFSLERALSVLLHPDQAASAWGHSGGSTPEFWFLAFALSMAAGGAAYMIHRSSRLRTQRVARHHRTGMATRSETARAAGASRLKGRIQTLRPSTAGASIHHVAHTVGLSAGIKCFVTVEDSTIILGPPRSGKGLHLVIPAILDAPGAVVTTSTRPDNITATLRARQSVGPVAVFDPQGLAPGIPSAARWSPIRGCEDPHVAMVRAKALTKGAASGTTDANFWQSSAEQAVRALLHAAALGGCDAADLYRWSLS
ncbi:MAG: type IV secretory system conjugative DNA transfer family protein, partial [Terrabacter sp.]|nr:type IV secretory system conjugative DNA transfer family protein [Terrabacter sp.]